MLSRFDNFQKFFGGEFDRYMKESKFWILSVYKVRNNRIAENAYAKGWIGDTDHILRDDGWVVFDAS